MEGHYLKALASQFDALDALDALDAALWVRGQQRRAAQLPGAAGARLERLRRDRSRGGDKFYKEALGIELVPSNPALRQMLDAQAVAMFDHGLGMIGQPLRSQRPDYGVLAFEWLALDVNTFAMDNGDKAKEGVGRTNAGLDGYCPLAAYLGAQGFCLELALRPGVQQLCSRD